MLQKKMRSADSVQGELGMGNSEKMSSAGAWRCRVSVSPVKMLKCRLDPFGTTQLM